MKSFFYAVRKQAKNPHLPAKDHDVSVKLDGQGGFVGGG